MTAIYNAIMTFTGWMWTMPIACGVHTGAIVDAAKAFNIPGIGTTVVFTVIMILVTLSLINGKYKMTILYTLMNFEVVRFNEMKKYIGEISYKTLSSTLKELEADQLVHRKEYPQIPPKVEYSLTERGKSLIPILDAMCDWGYHHRI